MSCWAVIPLKARGQAKRRLEAALSPPERLQLVERMFGHVLDTLRRTPCIDGIAVTSPEPVGHDVLWLVDRAGELNSALTDAAAELARRGTSELVVLHADLPRLDVADVEALIAEGRRSGVALAPDHHGRGTNAIYTRLPGGLEYQFGFGSLERHLEAAKRAGVTPALVRRPGLACDVDVPGDLRLLAPAPEGHDSLIADAGRGSRLDRAQALSLATCTDLPRLMQAAQALTLQGHGRAVTYSRKVFIPLTQLCRDLCGYCTFAQAPRAVAQAYLSPDQVLAIARAGQAAGCKEALFTLGDKPELRYPAAREALAALGHATTASYLEAMARLVWQETGLLPHLNPGVLSTAELLRLRPVSVSMGIMLESTAQRLCEKGGPHWGSPDKQPQRRLDTIRAAGEQRVPFTSGILIGIGETRSERIEALLALRELHDEFGHIQEVIIQNFRAKPGTRMAGAAEPGLEEQLWTIAVARLVFGADMSIQAPPNLQPGHLQSLVAAGINDWGGVSPVTPDHVNPEAPWPHLDTLAEQTGKAGRQLAERLALAPRYVREAENWVDVAMLPALLRQADSLGRARSDAWRAGSGDSLPAAASRWVDGAHEPGLAPELRRIVDQALAGENLAEAQIVALFGADGDDLHGILQAADRLRSSVSGDGVSYVVNRNINYTNICSYHCTFCAFAKGRSARSLRGPAYLMDTREIAARTVEAWNRGATEVCLQGGIHPAFTGETYLEIVAAVKAAVPGMHVHAFSPLEIQHGARTLGLELRDYLGRLQDAGLSTLPGTAAEILDDEVRARICPDKLSTGEWLDVMREAHAVGLRSTATIMFGHVDNPLHWARHLLRVRTLQAMTGGFTEFVPLPFVHMEAPMGRAGLSRPGPTLREAMLMHAVARLALHPLVTNIQVSWVKLGPEGAALALRAGANDLGGVLMNESITRAAGGANGQELSAEALERIARSIGREPRQRTTLYRPVQRASVETCSAA